MLSLAQIATLARATAERHAFAYTGNNGGALRYTVDVTLSPDGQLYLSAPCNARISEKRASAALSAVWEDLIARLDASTLDAHRALRSRGYKIWRTGFAHMGRFCTEGWRRGLEARPESAAA